MGLHRSEQVEGHQLRRAPALLDLHVDAELAAEDVLAVPYGPVARDKQRFVDLNRADVVAYRRRDRRKLESEFRKTSFGRPGLRPAHVAAVWGALRAVAPARCGLRAPHSSSGLSRRNRSATSPRGSNCTAADARMCSISESSMVIRDARPMNCG